MQALMKAAQSNGMPRTLKAPAGHALAAGEQLGSAV